MGPVDRDVVWNCPGRNGNCKPPPAPDDWVCPTCTSGQPNHAMEWYVKEHLNACPKCNYKRPAYGRQRRFQQTKCGRATAAAGKQPKAAAAKAAAKTAPPKAGANGAVADTKIVSDFRREVAALKADKAKLQKQVDAAKAPAVDDGDEFQDGNEGDDEQEGSKEEWQEEVNGWRTSLAARRKELKEATIPDLKADAEQAIEKCNGKIAELTKLIQSAQSPQ